jgi:tripartite ATP-independent transporter DctP family solute receptor
MFASGAKEAPAAGPAGFEKATLKFGTTSAEPTVIVKTMRAFAAKVLEKTGGQVTVEIFPSSQLGNATEIIRSTQMGAVDMCMAQPASLASMGAKELGVLVLPYIFKSYDQRMNVLFGPIGRELLDKIGSSNIQLKGFGYFPDGARNFFTVKGKAIRSIEDVKGMKLRVQPLPLDTDMAIALGASPTPIAFAELYAALQAGVVDGAEQPVTSYFAGKYHEVSSFLTLDEHTYNTLIILFSDLSWKKRTPALQKVLTESWDAAVMESKSAILKGEEDALVKIAAAGIEVIRPADRQKWIDAMKPVYTKHAVGLESLISRIQSTN